MSNATKNGTGTPRKQLSDQLDRLDTILDVLDEGLKGAVADAVREAVGAAVSEAVQAVLLELMTNPEIRKMAQQPAPDPPPRKDEEQRKPSGSLLSRAWGKVRSAAASCAGTVGAALTAARLAWCVASSKAKALVLGCAAAGGGAGDRPLGWRTRPPRKSHCGSSRAPWRR